MKKRIIARLDVKGPNVIKGIQFECLRVMGKPEDLAREYYLQGADELIYLDTVASLYQRNNLLNIVRQASENIFIPFTAGGGVRSISDIRSLLSAGAEKVAINTAATKNPNLIRQAARMFGSQCIVLSIEAKQIAPGRWEAYTDNGRNRTGLDVLKWAKRAESLGAGEILLTSVDMEGTERGLDSELAKQVVKAVSIPVIISGGAGSPKDISECFEQSGADAVAVASILHYSKCGVDDIKRELVKNKLDVRVTENFSKNKNKKGQNYDLGNYNKYTLQHLSGVTGSAANKIEEKDFLNFEKDYPKSPADIGIIDYKVNNVRSVLRAFQKIGKKVSIVETPAELKKMKAIVLPGVGSFGEGMRALSTAHLVEPLKEHVKQGKPILGLCLGMQMLFSESLEFGKHKGLDLIAGKVVPLKPVSEVKVIGYKLPHIGWNDIRPSKKALASSLTYGLGNPASVYFVHSFYPSPAKKSVVLATTKYGGQEFCSIVHKDNIMGTQFHPEKSGEVGLGILKQFCELAKV